MPRLCALLLLVAVSGAAGAADDGPVIEPIDIGFTEETGRSLLFLDVEGIDRKGRPLPGMTKEDFKIRVNYVWRKIYSVDDLCPCTSPDLANDGGETADPPEPEPDPVREAWRAVVEAPPHFILYFDFSQLQPAGREQAIREARTWATDTMQPDDRVMVVAFSTDAGLRRLSELTSDRDAVLGAIERADADPELVDSFPGEQAARQALCDDGTLGCYNVGRKEFFHARRSLETLRNFLTELDDIPARKTLLLFHENGSIFPGRLYADGASYLPQTTWDRLEDLRAPDFRTQRALVRRADSALVPDLLELSQEVGGSATASRTVVYPLACGTARDWNVNLGANLADGTGGEYNRRTEELSELLAIAGRRCACIYRIGLEMDGPRRSFVLRTKVKAQGRTLPSRYQLQYLTDADRWMRKAQLVLANPESWTDLDVGAAVLPIKASGSRWKARVEIGFDLDTLQLALDDDDGQSAEWEVAALLSKTDGEKHWEMLGVYRASPGTDGRLDSWILHERSFDELRPGRYELRAFVHDRSSDLYGAAVGEIELPDPRQPGLAGPVARLSERARLVGDLPLRKKKMNGSTTPVRVARGSLPLGDGGRVTPGEPVSFATLVCGVGSSDVSSAVLREADGRVFEGLTESVAGSDAAGRGCSQLVQSVDTWGLDAGAYLYRLRWNEGASEALAGFEVKAPDGPIEDPAGN